MVFDPLDELGQRVLVVVRGAAPFSILPRTLRGYVVDCCHALLLPW
jgi:hypothetical protein